jgi:hypothetical protein
MPSAKPAILQQVSGRNHNPSTAIATAKQAGTKPQKDHIWLSRPSPAKSAASKKKISHQP